MVARKPLFLMVSGVDVWSEQMVDSDSITLGGLTMGGNIAMGSNKISGLTGGTGSGEALAYAQSSASLAGLALTSNLAMGANKITGLAAGTDDTDAVNRLQLNSVAAGLQVKEAVRVATAVALPTYGRVGNVITASVNGAFPQIDGKTIVEGERILFKNGVSGSDNGIYALTDAGDTGEKWVLTRTADADSSAEVKTGMTVFVAEGDTYADDQWTLVTDGAIVLNSTSLTFTQFSSLAELLAGSGLDMSGVTLNINLESSNPSLQISSDKLGAKLDTTKGITSGADGIYVKIDNSSITFDGSGQLQAAASSSAAAVAAEHNVDEAITAGDPVYISSANRVGKALANSGTKYRVIGVTADTQGSVGQPATIVKSGICAAVLAGATAGDPYYLSAAGGLTSTPPSVAGDHYVRCGYAVNTTDLMVEIADLGRK